MGICIDAVFLRMGRIIRSNSHLRNKKENMPHIILRHIPGYNIQLLVIMMILLLFSSGSSFVVFKQRPRSRCSKSLLGAAAAAATPAADELFAAAVYDGVLSTNDCKKISLHVQKEKVTGFNVFDRASIVKEGHVSSIEGLLDSILRQLDDESRWVEYWWGSNWISHDMHRDVDERICFDQGLNRFPRNGHVLYLDKDEQITGGQTVILTEGKTVEGEEKLQRQLYIVPPHPGRLLRFNGSLLHSVPRPSLEYFLNGGLDAVDLLQLPVIHSLKDCPAIKELKHSAESRLDLTCPDYQRSMPVKRINLLFNTWPDKPPGSGNEASSTSSGGAPRGLTCLLPSEASKFRVPFQNDEGDADTAAELLNLKIKLPDDRRRRDSYEKTLRLRTPSSSPEAFVMRRTNE